MRSAITAARALAAIALALSGTGCSLLFPPSSYTDGRDGSARDAGVDASHDASLDAPLVDADRDAGSDDAGSDAGRDAPAIDANVDASAGLRDQWPSCPAAITDARDAVSRTVQPSAALRSALGLDEGAAFGAVSDRMLPGMPARISFVEVTSDATGILWVIAAPEGPGAPRSCASRATARSP